MLRNIAASRDCSELKPTNIVPWLMTVPYGMLRRKILPKRSWSVLPTCDSRALSSSSTLSAFLRPMTASCRATDSDSHATASWGPFLEQEDRPTRSRAPRWDQSDVRGVDQRGILGPVDEAGEITVMLVGPARGLLRDRGRIVELGDRLTRDLEDHVVGRSRQPQDGVVLSSRHHEAVDTDHVLVESPDAWRGIVGRRGSPDLRTKPGDQVDSAHRRPRFAKGRDHLYEVRSVRPASSVELEVRM